jgi:hypothetical protein
MSDERLGPDFIGVGMQKYMIFRNPWTGLKQYCKHLFAANIPPMRGQ